MEFDRRVFNSTKGLSKPGQGVWKVEIHHGKVQINPPEKFEPYFTNIRDTGQRVGKGGARETCAVPGIQGRL
jgi:hypothetical protein